MRLKLRAKEYVVTPPKVQPGFFTITRVAYNPHKPGTEAVASRRLVKHSKAVRVVFPDLPKLRFYMHRNEINGYTITENRTGLALHKTVDNGSTALCLSEATAKLETGFRDNKGPQGFEKHVASLPSKEEYVSPLEKPKKLCLKFLKQ